ncbi:hypothetical protein FOZ62_022937 [Perkinsus olseni]|nr:hypothetical protein FOZ62_022937 [Perkinsus olseni]
MSRSLQQDYEESGVATEPERPPSDALSMSNWEKFRKSAPARRPNRLHVLLSIKTTDPPEDFKKIKVIAYRDLEARKLGQPEHQLAVGVSSVPLFPDKSGYVDFTSELMQIQAGYSTPEDRYNVGDVFVTVLHCAADELECRMGKKTRIPCRPHVTIIIPQGVRYTFENKNREIDATLCSEVTPGLAVSSRYLESSQSTEEAGLQESSAPSAPMVQGFDYTVPLLMLAVVVLGAFNNLLGRMRAVPLGEYDFFTAVLNAVVYVTVWSTVFLSRRYTFKVTPKEQADFVWSVRGKWSLLMFGGLGDAIGGLLGFIGQPYVSGVMYSLMNQAIVPFTVIFSLLILGTRYISLELIGVLIVLLAVCLSMHNFTASHSDPFMAALIALSTSGNALSFVLKEKVFRSFVAWQTSAAHQPLLGDQQEPTSSPRKLDVFVVNCCVSVFQVVWLLPLLAIGPAIGKTHGLGLFDYLHEAGHCFVEGCPNAWQLYTAYIAVNLFYNAALLFLVQRGSALLAFVSLKAVTPASAILFSIDWPVLGPSTVTWLDWAEVVLVTIGIVAFRAGNLRKEEYIREGQRKICFA